MENLTRTMYVPYDQKTRSFIFMKQEKNEIDHSCPEDKINMEQLKKMKTFSRKDIQGVLVDLKKQKGKRYVALKVTLIFSLTNIGVSNPQLQ